MTPAPTGFDFEAVVPTSGYRWVSGSEMRARWATDSKGERRPFGDWFLIEDVATDDDWHNRKRVYPGSDPVLFQRFAELDHSDRDAILAFAKSNGNLDLEGGSGVAVHVYCDPRGPARRLYQVLDSDNPDPGPDGLPAVSFSGEPYKAWVGAINNMKTAVTVFGLLRKSDSKGLRGLIHWGLTGFQGEFGDRLPQRAWIIDTHPNLAGDDRPVDRVRDVIFTDHTATAFDDIAEMGWAWLIRTINTHLRGTASPCLVLKQKGQVSEHLVPNSLLAAMWAQLYAAIAGNKSYSRCPCGQWFEVTGKRKPGEKTARARYCSPACRVGECRRRQAKAIELNVAGRPVKEIAGELGTDIPQIKRWIKSAKVSKTTKKEGPRHG